MITDRLPTGCEISSVIMVRPGAEILRRFPAYCPCEPYRSLADVSSNILLAAADERDGADRTESLANVLQSHYRVSP